MWPEIGVIDFGVCFAPIYQILQNPLILLPPLTPSEVILLTVLEHFMMRNKLLLFLRKILQFDLPLQGSYRLPIVKYSVKLFDPLLHFIHLGLVFRCLAAYQHLLDVLVDHGFKVILAEDRNHIAGVDVAWILLDQSLHGLLIHGTLLSEIYTV